MVSDVAVHNIFMCNLSCIMHVTATAERRTLHGLVSLHALLGQCAMRPLKMPRLPPTQVRSDDWEARTRGLHVACDEGRAPAQPHFPREHSRLTQAAIVTSGRGVLYLQLYSCMSQCIRPA